MNLETFIAQSLVQIARGIEKANEELTDSQAIVSPKNVKDVQKSNDSTYGLISLSDGSWAVVQEIGFDVAVTAAKGGEAKAGAGITVGAVTIGAAGKEDRQDTSVSRIRFSVPMLMPQYGENG